MRWVFDDGGRKAAGFRGQTGDCTCRAMAIVMRRPYREIYDELNAANHLDRPRKNRNQGSARTGVSRAVIRRYLQEQGSEWTPTMHIGSGCKVHLRADELPSGRLVVNLSRHLAAVIDGTVYDLSDPSRDGTRCVYGYWMLPQAPMTRP